MEKRDCSQLNKQLKLVDIYADEEDLEVLAGVAIRAEDVDAFAEAVEKLAVEQFGGATFSELVDNGEADMVITASIKQSNKEDSDSLIAAAERIMRNGAEN